MTAHVFAVEHIRRMRGGAQAQLLRCSDGGYYVVKFQNNPQGMKVLANELLGTWLAERLGLPVPPAQVVRVSQTLILNTEEMVVQLEHGCVPLRSGSCYGSRYPESQSISSGPALLRAHDYLPKEQLWNVENRPDFAGMFVFDKWSGNTDIRQAVFIQSQDRSSWRALMIDQGFCFNGDEWDFPDAPRCGICLYPTMYDSVSGIDAFEPWLDRLERRIDRNVLGLLGDGIPQEWYRGNENALRSLLDELDHRRKRIRDIVWNACQQSRRFFPNWIRKVGQPCNRVCST
jgi:HipA-like kinase